MPELSGMQKGVYMYVVYARVSWIGGCFALRPMGIDRIAADETLPRV